MVSEELAQKLFELWEELDFKYKRSTHKMTWNSFGDKERFAVVLSNNYSKTFLSRVDSIKDLYWFIAAYQSWTFDGDLLKDMLAEIKTWEI